MKTQLLPKICLVAACAALPVAADTAALSPEHDSYVRKDNATGNSYGGETKFFVGYASATAIARALLTFDLSTIPDNATITTAALSIWQTGDDGSSTNADMTISVFDLGSTLSTETPSWTSAAMGNFDVASATVLSTATLRARPAQSGGYGLPHEVTFDSTADFVAAIQAAYESGAQAITLVLAITSPAEGGSGRYWAQFDSTEAATANIPSLALGYTVAAVPEPATTALFLGLLGLAGFLVHTKGTKGFSKVTKFPIL
ncbi:MAG: DNRLRE domain-containing protein [Opitutaceae bacterium]|jgi:hypothetical protein|nr:DNRLRE domain-containing protein [Opitutaceae bacterium]